MRMQSFCLILIVCCLTALSAAEQVSIYDIQYTPNPGAEGTYPSLYAGSTVQTEGVVSAIGYNSTYFILSNPEGGPWNSIAVQASDLVSRNYLRVGDYVTLVGDVNESFGYTEIKNIEIIHRRTGYGEQPQPYEVTTGELAVSESLEGVLVKMRSVGIVTMRLDARWSIDDGTGNCTLFDGFSVMNSRKRTNQSGDTLEYIQGVVAYRFGEYLVCPRTISDLSSTGSHQVQGTSWGRVKSLYK